MSLDYFNKTSLKILFEALKDKYFKASKLTGTIKIYLSTKDEVTEIEKLIRNGKYLKINELNVIKIIDIRKGIEKSKYCDYSLEDILAYLYGPLKSKKTIKEEKEEVNLQKYKTFVKQYKGSKIVNLLSKIPQNEIIQNLNKDEVLFYNVCDGILAIPDFPVILSVFSTNITKDPHYFDLETKASNLLIKYLALSNDKKIPKTRYEKVNLLKSFNIITDAYSNYVITYNLWGEDYLNALSLKGEPILLNINNIVNINNLYTKNKKVLILENPSVLDYLIKLNIEYGIIIGGGNPNAAVYELLAKLPNHEFFYNGDYDPEGLLIADKLSQKYNNLKLIMYSEKLFTKSKSDKIVSEARIKILDNLTNKDLINIGNLIKETKNVGYQEKIIDDLINYIKEKSR